MIELQKEEIKGFLYENGSDRMINMNTSEIPECPGEFVTKVRLIDGTVIDAPPKWRKMIWERWHEDRKAEIQSEVLLRACAIKRATGQFPRTVSLHN